ncbi:ABC-2 type transport system permease protein [Enterococcus rotai]|uniref:Transport permease protein n=1 Tax=Enterococcus rotai TaxID=118060 RepID=A0A0U2XBZ1_9ENTE|nr:ABC transporter permease [Enterococcus rotai]ALS37680.1 ABC transporter [Enterococcus rotai]
MSAFRKQLVIEVKLYFRQPLYLIFSVIMPVVSLIIFGSMYSEQKYDGADFFSMFIPGFCVLILYASSIFNIGSQIVSDKEKGIYKRILVTPVSLFRFISVIVFKAYITAWLSFFLILLTSRLLFSVYLLSKIGFIFGYSIFILYALLIGIGISFITQKVTTFSAVMMGSFFPMFMLSDAAIPLAMMPAKIQQIAKFNPLFQANQILRSFWVGKIFSEQGFTLWKSYLFLIIIGIAIYTIVLFKWKNRESLF